MKVAVKLQSYDSGIPGSIAKPANNLCLSHPDPCDAIENGEAEYSYEDPINVAILAIADISSRRLGHMVRDRGDIKVKAKIDPTSSHTVNVIDSVGVQSVGGHLRYPFVTEARSKGFRINFGPSMTYESQANRHDLSRMLSIIAPPQSILQDLNGKPLSSLIDFPGAQDLDAVIMSSSTFMKAIAEIMIGTAEQYAAYLKDEERTAA